MSPPSFSPAGEISSTETLTSSSPPTSSAEEEECALSNIQPLPATVSGDELIHSSASAGGEEDSSHHDHSSRANVESTHNTASTWTGFRIVGDNIDRSLRPRHQTLDSRTRSFHYFNSYAVLDRCNFSAFDDCNISLVSLSDFDVKSLLLSSSDLQQLHQNMAVIVWRILTEHLTSISI